MFFQLVSKISYITTVFLRDRMYYVREMRIIAYTQLLESYRSLTLQYMADAFGVSVVFIDR